jgi:hypothetical protein
MTTMTTKNMEWPGPIMSPKSIFDPVKRPRSDRSRYYHQRHRLFSKFDEGIQMTPSSWFEVTPEAVAT